MKRKIVILFGLITIVFFILWHMGNYQLNFLLKDLTVFLCGAGIVISLYLLDRVIVFKKKIELALNHILENNFQTGISLAGNDEFCSVAKKFNRAIDRINDYDRLREKKIDSLLRLINSLNRNIQYGIMILELDTSLIKINRAAQEIFDISQDELSIDSVIKLEANKEFTDLYKEIITGKANALTSDLEIWLPILKTKAFVNLRMFGIKDSDEILQTVICIFSKSSKV